MSLLNNIKLSNPNDLPHFLSQLNGSYDSLTQAQTRDLLAKISSWRAEHAKTDFQRAQNQYWDEVMKRRKHTKMDSASSYRNAASSSRRIPTSPNASFDDMDRSTLLLNSDDYDPNAYNATRKSSNQTASSQQNMTPNSKMEALKRKKQELMELLKKEKQLEEEVGVHTSTNQTSLSSSSSRRQLKPESAYLDDAPPKRKRGNNRATIEADSGIVTVSANTTEADPHNPDLITSSKDQFKKPKRAKITVPKPFSFDAREKYRRKTISERRFEEYIDSIHQKEDELINHRFVAAPVPASTLEPRYRELQEQAKARSDEIKEMSKKWLIKTQKPFEFLKTTTYDDKKRQHLEKIKEEAKFVRKPFKANPLPEWIGEKQMHQFEAENILREKRIKERAQRLYEESKLPPRMEMWKQKEQDEKKENTNPLSNSVAIMRRHSSGSVPDKFANPNFTFHPKVNLSIPNFNKLQKKFEQELRRKKAANKRAMTPPTRHVGSRQRRPASASGKRRTGYA